MSIKVAICIPSHDHWAAGFGHDLAHLTAFTTATLVNDKIIDGDLSILMVNGSLLPASRETLAIKALKSEATHLFWLDADMRFPKDALIRLLEHNQQMVGCNYVARGVPTYPVAFKSIDWTVTEGPRPKERLYTRPESTGIEEVDGLGFGCVLMHVSVLGSIHPPGFLITHENGHWVGEDINFCRAVRAAGIPIYVDHDLSKHVHHVGTFQYGHEHVLDAPEPLIVPAEQPIDGPVKLHTA